MVASWPKDIDRPSHGAWNDDCNNCSYGHWLVITTGYIYMGLYILWMGFCYSRAGKGSITLGMIAATFGQGLVRRQWSKCLTYDENIIKHKDDLHLHCSAVGIT